MAADTVVLATRNAAKLRELARILGAEDSASRDGGEQIRLAGLDEFPGAPDVPETGATFEENALLKARAIADYTGLPAVADDSGLCVDALNGMPGVLSARWAGRAKDDHANNLLLLDQLTDVPDGRRAARFQCVVALCHPNGEERVAPGIMPGRVIRELRGSGGFGYDVLFVPDEQEGELTSAEMTPEAKDLISHRGHSLRAIAPAVVELLGS